MSDSTAEMDDWDEEALEQVETDELIDTIADAAKRLRGTRPTDEQVKAFLVRLPLYQIYCPGVNMDTWMKHALQRPNADNERTLPAPMPVSSKQRIARTFRGKLHTRDASHVCD